MIGTIVGNYRLSERLGEGGFATVYRAVPLAGGPPVAVKVLRPEYGTNPEFVRRFHREVDLVRRLPAHPNIARPLGDGLIGRLPYLVLEYLDGQDLSARLGSGRQLDARLVCSIGRQVAHALAVAHHHGVIHRDVKPENIRLSSAGVVKLMDFGIARAAHGLTLTQANVFVGTPPYIPPEGWTNGPIDGRWDVYALGVVLYQALAGRLPFDGDTAAIMTQHLQGRPAPLSTYRHDLPNGLETLIRKAMARDLRERFQSAGELAAALADITNGVVDLGFTTPMHGEGQLSTPPAVAPAVYLVADGRRMPLSRTKTVIGRAPDSQIAVVDGKVSGHHAAIERRGSDYFLSDLGSRNGTFVNDRKVEIAVRLQSGDRIRFGRQTYQFVTEAGRAVVGPNLRSRGDDSLLAAVAHASALLAIGVPASPLFAACVLVPLVVWLLAGRATAFVGEQAVQALALQLVLLLAVLAVGAEGAIWVWVPLAAYAAYGALRCLQGDDFRYPLLGALLVPVR